jgi:Protein of unknown function (DUF3485)
MSTTDLTMTSSTAERPQTSRGFRARGTTVPWVRVVVACVVLAAAGTLRWWQGERVKAILAEGRMAPFPLQSLPMTLGHWYVPEQREETLEPEIQSALNCTDFLRRHYVDERTGVVVEVLILYGPSTIAHFPEVCYPGSGYRLVEGPTARTFAIGAQPASFNSLVFVKGEGGMADRQHVLYALRYDDHWTTNIDYRKLPRLPGLYKIQLTRRIGERERLDVANPCESLLETLLPELERRITTHRAETPR